MHSNGMEMGLLFQVQESATIFALPCEMLHHTTTTPPSSSDPVDLASKIHGIQNGKLGHRVSMQMQGLIVDFMQLAWPIATVPTVASNNIS